ncbi:MAG: hypothetical protein JW843_10480 [Candidatus Aminicenantes bacterium]|nr:hypothetical protein [Candidatus Aminicenantes bacterium]
MLCPLTRWFISRFEDTGKAIPPWVVRHVGRCASCRSFAAFSDSLPARFCGERSSLLDDVPDAPPRRNVPHSRKPDLARRSRFRSVLRPVPAAALVLILAAGVFLLRGILSGPPLTAERAKAALADLRKAAAVTREWPGFVRTAESSLDQERIVLENAARSAYAFLQDRLNLTIERKDSTRIS